MSHLMCMIIRNFFAHKIFEVGDRSSKLTELGVPATGVNYVQPVTVQSIMCSLLTAGYGLIQYASKKTSHKRPVLIKRGLNGARTGLERGENGSITHAFKHSL